MQLIGVNISLRPPMMQDAQQILEWENATEVVELSGHQGGLRLKDIQNYIASIRDVYMDKQLRWVICKNDSPLGTLDIFDVDFEAGRAHVGVLVADRSTRRAGLGTEALNLLHGYCHEILNLRKLVAEVQADNKGSQLFFESMGYIKKEMEDDILRYECDISQV